MERTKIPTAAAGRRDDDRISALPDEILQHILARLKSQKLFAKATVLSKRWANLWFSYPILEFNDNDFDSKESLKSFAAAAVKRFSSSVNIDTVTITFNSHWMANQSDFCTAILDDLLGSVAKKPPRKLNATASHYNIPRELLLLPAATAGGRIKDLTLQNCKFNRYGVDIFSTDNNNNPFGCLCGSLRKLSLRSVEFPADGGGRILNSMIAGASLLEELTLMFFKGVRRVEVRDLLNLKYLKLYASDGRVDFDIAWAHRPLKDGAMAIVLTPDLKQVEITSSDTCIFTNWQVNELILESPTMTSTSDLSRVQELKIVINNDESNEVTLSSWKDSLIDLPTKSFLPYVKIGFFPTILSEDGKSFALVTIHSPLSLDHFHGLGKLLAKLNQFWLSIEFIHEFPNGREEDGDHFKDADPLPAPVIEHVKISQKFLTSCNKKEVFLDTLFYCCRPKFLSFTKRIYRVSRENMLSATEYIQQLFVKRDSDDRCHTKCNCWRYQLKDVRILKRTVEDNIKEDTVINISNFMFSSLGEQDQIWFVLIWR